MYGDTLPSIIWIIYYLVLLSTLIKGIFNIKKNFLLGSLDIIIPISMPIIGIVNSIGRGPGINELEHLVSEIQVGAFWAIYVAFALLYIIFSLKFLFIKYYINIS